MKAFPRDVDVKTMTIRHIGIENELDTHTTNFSKLRCHDLLSDVGWDGGGREFRTIPISLKSLKQVRGLKYLSQYYDDLKSITEVIGSGGTHIHISILDSDHPNMESNATALGIAFFEQFQKISGRQTHWAGRMRGQTIDGLRRELLGAKYTGEGRAYCRKGSMLGPTYHQTLEFRGGVGSNDKTEILAWIEFLENVVKVANRECIEGVKFGKLLRGERISDYVKGLDDWRKITKEDLELTFNGQKLQ